MSKQEVAVNTNVVALEQERLTTQAAFDLEADARSRNEHGQFATPPPLADAMVSLAMRFLNRDSPIRFLDPALGSGVFYSSLLRQSHARTVSGALGFETDSRLA